MDRDMNGIAVSSTLMALVFLGMLYILFSLGLRENMAPLDDGAKLVEKLGACTLASRAEMLVLAWNETINSPQKVNADTNVYYRIWSSNVLRRNLDPIYTEFALFAHMYELSINGQLDRSRIQALIAPYYLEEQRLAAERQPKMMPLQPVCMN